MACNDLGPLYGVDAVCDNYGACNVSYKITPDVNQLSCSKYAPNIIY